MAVTASLSKIAGTFATPMPHGRDHERADKSTKV